MHLPTVCTNTSSVGVAWEQGYVYILHASLHCLNSNFPFSLSSSTISSHPFFFCPSILPLQPRSREVAIYGNQDTKVITTATSFTCQQAYLSQSNSHFPLHSPSHQLHFVLNALKSAVNFTLPGLGPARCG